jgi:hypothetical protein
MALCALPSVAIVRLPFVFRVALSAIRIVQQVIEGREHVALMHARRMVADMAILTALMLAQRLRAIPAIIVLPAHPNVQRIGANRLASQRVAGHRTPIAAQR